MEKIYESYGKIGRGDRQFDVQFWQSQGEKAIFDAALDMVMDYLRLSHEHVDEPRLQRNVESFHKI